MNRAGVPANLRAAHPANLSAAKHGLYSDRPLAPRIEAYREQLLALPHVAPVDAGAGRIHPWTERWRQRVERLLYWRKRPRRGL